MEIQNHRQPLRRTLEALRNGKLTLGFIGGSVTDGRFFNNWPEPVTAWFVERFPDARIVVENAAIGATGSELGIFRAKRDLIDRGADLVFVEYAANDNGGSDERNRRTQEGLIRKLLSAGCDVVLAYIFFQPMYQDMIAGKVFRTIAAFEELAEHYRLGSVWMGKHALNELMAGKMRWEEWLPDNIHPGHRGSLSYAQPVIAFLEKELCTRDLAVASKAKARKPQSAAAFAKLPAPLDKRNWEHCYGLDLAQVKTVGPWTLRRSLSFVWYDMLLDTSVPGAKLSFDFDGRALLLGFDFSNNDAEFVYRLDGGDPVASNRDHPAWYVNSLGWYRTFVIAENLKPGRHHLELEVIHGDRPDCRGTNFRLALIGVVP